jgi:hypothetical protein
VDAKSKTSLPETLPLNVLIGARQRVKERLEKKEAEFVEDCKPLKEALTRLEGQIVLQMDANNLVNVKTEYGTAFFQFPVSMKVADRDVFFRWVVDNNAWDVLTTNVSKEAIREREITPPGVEVTEIRKLYIRKPG